VSRKSAPNLRPLGRAALVVVGCGPTGVAGLVQAALEGIPAIGIEAGPAPLASILGYMEGLLLTSPAAYYEVGALPLDCAACNRLTREEVLHYYARVISHHGLDIRCGTRCIGLEPIGRHVLVRVTTSEGLGWFRADRVLVTSWYEKRPLDPDLLSSDHKIAVHYTVQNPILFAGKKVVVLGGGLSAYEYATRLMENGQTVVLLARCAARPIFQDPRFRRLVAATGSAVFHRISGFVLGRSRVRFTHKGAKCTVHCDALVAAIGQRLREEVLQILSGARVLSRRECRLLRQARSYERLIQEFPNEDEAALMQRAAAELPDLKQQLFQGRRGVHLAGGALHAGSSNGGVVYSLFSATLAVRTIAGHPLPEATQASLPEYLSALPLPEKIPQRLAFARISDLRPQRASVRTSRPALSDAEEGQAGQSLWQEDPSCCGPPEILRERPEIEMVVRDADGTRSVGNLARRLGMRTGIEQAALFSLLRHLWWTGGLTWLPAGGRQS